MEPKNKLIMLVVGTRPNFIKAAPIHQQLTAEGFRVVVVHTGQHYSKTLSKYILDDLNLPIDHHFKCRTSDRFILVPKLEKVMLETTPDLVIVFGDVNSTFSGVVAAKRCGIPIAHVEAGLRSKDWSMEEELNRYLVDAVADILFVTEQSGIDNIKAEFTNKIVSLVGNTAMDSLTKKHPEVAVVDKHLPEVVVTLHRKENIDSPKKLATFMKLLENLHGMTHRIAFYAHPHILRKIKEYSIKCPIELSEPLPYNQCLQAIYNAKLVITDSGGASTEAVALGTPCAVYREEDHYEHKICLEAQMIASTNLVHLQHYCRSILAQRKVYQKGMKNLKKWSDGKAAQRIVVIIKEFFNASV